MSKTIKQSNKLCLKRENTENIKNNNWEPERGGLLGLGVGATLVG